MKVHHVDHVSFHSVPQKEYSLTGRSGRMLSIILSSIGMIGCEGNITLSTEEMGAGAQAGVELILSEEDEGGDQSRAGEESAGALGGNSGRENIGESGGATTSMGGSNPPTRYLSAEEDCPERAHFLDVTQFEGPGGGHPSSRLAVRCEGDRLSVSSNGIPHYLFVQITPNALSAQTWEWSIPRQPVIADQVSTIPLLGTVGFAINGVPFYGPNEGQRPDPFGDPVYNDILDECLGHTANNGDYHYHALLVRCLSNLGIEGVEDPSIPSPIIGYALDGFPIYGPLGCLDDSCDEVTEFKSGWRQVGDPSTYAWDQHEYLPQDDPSILDQCNGRVGPDGRYRYHATTAFPYILGCFKGNLSAAEQGDDMAPDGEGGMPPNGGGGVPPNGGGEMMRPTSCTQQSDCETSEACSSELGCECATTPMGMSCIPTCETNSDCPQHPRLTLICGMNQLCVPQR